MTATQWQALDALFNKGVTLHKQGQLAQAQSVYEQVLMEHPAHFESMHLLGVIAGQSKRPDIAAKLFAKAIAINPNFAEVHNNYGNALQELGQLNEALDCYETAIKIKPNFALAYFNRGNALKQLNRTDEALNCYDKAITIQPDYAIAYIHRGNLLLVNKCLEAAIVSYDRAIAINPNIAEAHSNRANVLQALSKFVEAVASYDTAISLNPNFAEAYSNRGNALLELKRIDEAVKSYELAIYIEPEVEYLLGTLLNARMYMCEWANFDDICKRVIASIKDNKKISPPFQILSTTDGPDIQRKAAQIWNEDKNPLHSFVNNATKLTPAKKIRLGYFSGDFREHAVSYLTAELFEIHDKDRFELIAFDYGPADHSLIRKRIETAFNEYKNVRSLSDKNIASLSREMEIDIAIDLSGLTKYGRPGVFSYRASPVQLSYLGYLGTMGSDAYDYLIADETLIPERYIDYYSEKIIYLPSYQINDSKRVISSRIFTKEELGLPANSFVYCCFNNTYKITPLMFDVWMSILLRVPESVLFLYAENKWATRNLKKEAERRGVNNSRLIFADHIDRDEYLARYKVADLFLDTYPYNAGTTASDSLWSGLPVLTCSGESFASRMASSILTSLELPELITSSLQQYEAIAVDLASNKSKLDEIRCKLNVYKNKSILFDAVKMTKKIEEAYLTVYERNVSGLPLDHVYVK